MAIETSSPEANYATRTNIVHPESNLAHANSVARVDAAETRANEQLQARRSYEAGTTVTVSGHTIKRGK